MTDYTKLVEALRCCARWHMADNALANAEQAADAIEALQAELEQCTLFNTGLLNMREMSKEEADEILEYIRNAPIWPIDQMQIEQLPKRGEWIIKGQYILCSVCGEESAYNWWGASKFSNYCPNCGAKMEVQDESAGSL